MSNVQTPEVKENKAKFYIDAFRQAFDEQNHIPIQSVPEEHRKVFAVWRQHLGAVVVWFSRYARYKDYGAAVNAAFALGKLHSVPKPDGYVSELDLNAFDTMCSNMWDDITAQHMRPVEEPQVKHANTAQNT